MKKGFIALVGALAIGLSMNAYADDKTKIGIVNVPAILQESKKVSEFGDDLRKKFKGREEAVMKAQKDLQEMLKKAEKDAAVLSQKDKDALQEKITSERDHLVKMQESFQKDVGTAQQSAMAKIFESLQKVVQKVAKDKGLDLVLQQQSVAYAADSMDITKEVAKEFAKASL